MEIHKVHTEKADLPPPSICRLKEAEISDTQTYSH